MAKRAFPPSSHDERRAREREMKMRDWGTDPDESERRDWMGGMFCFVSCRNVEL